MELNKKESRKYALCYNANKRDFLLRLHNERKISILSYSSIIFKKDIWDNTSRSFLLVFLKGSIFFSLSQFVCFEGWKRWKNGNSEKSREDYYDTYCNNEGSAFKRRVVVLFLFRESYSQKKKTSFLHFKFFSFIVSSVFSIWEEKEIEKHMS